MQSNAGRVYSFILTKNNPRETLQEFFDTTLRVLDPRWLVVQLEVGEKGTPHFQAAFGFKHAKLAGTIQRKMGGCHIEPARNAQAVAEYCRKSDTAIEGPLTFGKPPLRRSTKAGHLELNRRCLEEGVEALIADGTLSFKEYTKVKRGVDLYKQVTDTPDDNPEFSNEWHYGPTGTGKSKTVREKFGHSMFNKAINRWFEGYAGQETVLLDDFGKEHHVLGHYLKQWADHYTFQAETKGGTIKIRPQRIVVTSNYHPEEIWGGKPEELYPILRRFKLHHYN